MKRHLFTRAAQNSIDDFSDDIERLKKLAKKSDTLDSEEISKAIYSCKEDESLLIDKYNVLTSCDLETWPKAQSDFKSSLHASEKKIENLILKIKGMKKQDFKDRIHANIEKTDTQINKLKAEMSDLSEEAKTTYEEQIDKLEKSKLKFENKYDELKDIAEDKWEETKESFKTSMDSLKDTMKHLFD